MFVVVVAVVVVFVVLFHLPLPLLLKLSFDSSENSRVRRPADIWLGRSAGSVGPQTRWLDLSEWEPD